MPYDLCWSIQSVSVRFFGHVTTAEFLDGARIVGEDMRFDNLRFIVNDFQDVSSHDLSVESVLENLAVTAVGASASNPDVRVAVITSDPSVVSLAKAFGGIVGERGPQVVLFECAEHAVEWMGQARGARRWRGRFDK